jgi:hypothetical protein
VIATVRRWASATIGMAVVGMAVAACGGSSGGPNAASGTTTVTATAAAATTTQAPATAANGAPTSNTAPAAPPAPASTATPPAIPEYHPSTLVSKSPSSTVLTSPDSVTQVGNFYKDALAKGGWQISASSGSAYSANLSGHRASEGVSISVYSRGAGTGISITTHPE